MPLSAGWPLCGRIALRLKLATRWHGNRLFENKLEYLKLVLKISRIRNRGDDPPEALLKQAFEMGRLAGISEDELNRL